MNSDGNRSRSFRRTSSFMRPRVKLCYFCVNPGVGIDYKNIELLSKFISDKGKILPRRATGACAKHQRRIAQEIKRAREIALLPFVVK
jgi:small subunit ribosomal protein S18